MDAYSKRNSPLPSMLVAEGTHTVLGRDNLTMPKNGANLGASSASAMFGRGVA